MKRAAEGKAPNNNYLTGALIDAECTESDIIGLDISCPAISILLEISGYAVVLYAQ